MKTKIYGLTGFAILMLALLTYQLFTRENEPIGFERNFKDLNPEVSKSLELPLSSMFYYVGNSKEGLYFKDHRNMEVLSLIDFNLSGIKKIPLRLAKGFNGSSVPVNIEVHDSLVYITDKKNAQLTILNNISGSKHLYKGANVMLNAAYAISGQSLVGRVTDLNDGKPSRRLVKLDIPAGRIDTSFQLKKQVDGFFCTDGVMVPSPDRTKVYYAYAYRGAFLCLDTNLNLQYQAKTIDTVTIAKIKPVSVDKSGQSTTLSQSGPAPVVNKNLVTYKNSLLVLSALRSDNENYIEHKRNEVIDVYQAADGSYKFSFYIPKFKGLKLRSFYLQDDFIYCVFGTYLVKYKINRPVEM